MPRQFLENLLRDLYSPNPQDAWAAFLSEYATLIYQVVHYLEADPDNAADCFQFVCEQLIDNRSKRLRKFKGDGPATFTTWLRAIVRNLCIDWHRKQFGRQRPFSSMSRLTLFDQQVFRMIYERAVSPEECVAALAREFPDTTLEKISNSREHIESVLTSNQRRLLAQRAAQRNGNAERSEELLRNVEDVKANPEAQAIENERKRKLESARKTLSPNERLLIRLRFEEGMTLDKAAALLGLGNAQKADRQIKEILARLRKLM
jgi:RNA polymerase sigma factor (sigma-70 family)